ncbi:MAG: vitamin K epoxide reductase family protein [Cyanosarcina radialis HA8281-LM2]|jgi:uncharacterized membrane protein|nr:vitamin K epoxide reductase family protein [Cyanosarcina radialis HA8281-LM2]
MTRRRSTPWIHRWSRIIIGAIAICGALVTGYLTWQKLSGGKAVCLAGSTGCDLVLGSQYATVFGQPLALFGFLAYVSMAVFALAPLAVRSDEQIVLRKNLENWTWLLLLAGGTAMAVFSGYLMYLLLFYFKTPCPYCIASAVFSLSLLVLAVIGRYWEDVGQLFFISIVVGMLTLIATVGIYAKPTAETPSASGCTPLPELTIEQRQKPQPPAGWPVTTTSGADEIALAKHLKQTGAKMYGAWWCPHCYEQKEMFGKEAYKEFNYIECAPQGTNPQPELCSKVGIKGFPTWEVKGKLVEGGTQKLQKLAELSGYQGSTNFKYCGPAGG